MSLAFNKYFSSVYCSNMNPSACDMLLAGLLLPHRIWDRSLLSVQKWPRDKGRMVVCIERLPADPSSCPTVPPSCQGASRQLSASLLDQGTRCVAGPPWESSTSNLRRRLDSEADRFLSSSGFPYALTSPIHFPLPW